VNTWVAFLAATGVVLSVCYALWLYRRVIFEVLSKTDLKLILDLNRREVLMFAPLVVLVLLFGIWPIPLLEVFHVSVENLIAQHQLALGVVPAADVLVAAK